MNKFIFLDTETTGFNKDHTTGEITNDRVIQLGYLVLDGNKHYKVNVLASPPKGVDIKIPAMSVHNITPEMVEGKPLLQDTEGFKTLNKDLNVPENFLVIHNSVFDLEMLERDGFQNKMQLIDTLQVAKHLYPDEESHSLQRLRYSLGLYKKEEEEFKKLDIVLTAHDALADVLFMKILFTQLFSDIKKNFNIENKVDIIKKMLELTQKRVLVKIFKFGKYKGQKIEDIVKKDSNYMNWILNNYDDEDLKYTINYWRNKDTEKSKSKVHKVVN